jgi:amidohydrolase
VDELQRRIVASVDALRDEIAETNRWLFEHPELSNEEFASSKYLAARAAKHGFEVEMGVAGLPTAFRGVRKPTFRGKRMAYLAEYDALPGVGHGCGHNMIGTIGTYAAIALGSVVDDLPGDVALFGTPAEETDGGKIIMLEAGAFDDVAAAMMVHPGVYTEVAYASLACSSLNVEFHGKTSHSAASPWKGINALDAMIQLFVSIDLLRKQLPLTARCPGVILDGGTRANMVPEYSRGQFSVRGKDVPEMEMVLGKVLECARGAAVATGCRMEHFADGHVYEDMRPDPQLAEWYRENWKLIGGEEPESVTKPHGSLDIGNLSQRFPCLHPSVRITENDSVAGHSRDFAQATQSPLAEEQMLRAIKALALTGLQVVAHTSRGGAS